MELLGQLLRRCCSGGGVAVILSTWLNLDSPQHIQRVGAHHDKVPT